MEIEALIHRYPYLYHMAERESWPSIRRHGLLSTTALLDRHGINGKQRLQFEEAHRPEKVPLVVDKTQTVILRDQKPMSDDRLEMCLQEGLTPRDWYKLLNGMVFFWVSEQRLLRLLNARAYRNDEHDVIKLRSGPLIQAHFEKIRLCHMNSGNTWPYPHKRGKHVFQKIEQYPAHPRTKVPLKEVVELVVDYGLDINEYVVSVKRMRGDQLISQIHP